MFRRRNLEIFFSYFSQVTGVGISCKLSPFVIVSMKCKILFSEKYKKYIINLSSAECDQKVKIKSQANKGTSLKEKALASSNK